ncbi:MAG: DASS family sodium-coupled anion symporter [Sulfurospirillaceae bacterium]|nr:DASS family sodium-coupled anion symporter [Sulfurospirillaceae bacterium]
MDKNIKHIVLGIVLGLIGFGLALFAFSPTQAKLLGVIVFLVTLWTNEGLPIGVVSLLPIVLFPALGVLETGATTANYSKSTIFLFLGGFLLAVATEKINLHKVIASKITAVFPSTTLGLIGALATSAAVLSSFLSNTTTALLLIPIASFLTEDMRLKVRLILAIAYGASIGGIITPIGTPPNLILMGFMESKGLELISFTKWMGLTIPLAVIMLILMTYVLSIGAKGIDTASIDMEHKTLTKEQSRLLKILGGLILLLLVNSPIKPYYSGLGLDEKVILLSFGLLMFVPKIGFLTWQDNKRVPYEIMFLFGAGFAIAAAFGKTGLASAIATHLLVITSLPPFAILLCVALLITFTTEVTSNTALISIALPIIYSLGQASNMDMTLILMTATICASYAFMLPIATPPNAIAMSTGAVDVKTMAKYGLVFNLIGVVAIIAVSYFFWQYFI